MLDFINKKCEIFNLKRFKIVLLATINLIIVTKSLLLNLYTVLLLKIYDQKRQLDDILIKDVITSRNIAFERVKSKTNSTFLAVKQFIQRMINQGMSWKVGCLNSLLSHFFIEKMFFSVFTSFKVKSFYLTLQFA